MPEKKSSFRKFIFLAVSLFLVYLFAAGNYNVFDLWKLHKEKQDLQDQIAAAEHENLELTKQVDLLENDKAYIEKIAREQYRMGKEGERVYIVTEQADK